MAGLTKIEWTEATWNPVTGCDKVSPGCKNCYAERLALRLQAAGTVQYKKRTSAKIKFLSLEPLLGPLPRLDLEGIDWVIVGEGSPVPILGR
jgi:protein gp37